MRYPYPNHPTGLSLPKEKYVKRQLQHCQWNIGYSWNDPLQRQLPLTSKWMSISSSEWLSRIYKDFHQKKKMVNFSSIFAVQLPNPNKLTLGISTEVRFTGVAVAFTTSCTQWICFKVGSIFESQVVTSCHSCCFYYTAIIATSSRVILQTLNVRVLELSSTPPTPLPRWSRIKIHRCCRSLRGPSSWRCTLSQGFNWSDDAP